MIDLNMEHVLTLREACEHLPRRRNGSRPHPATIWRWTKNGCRGVRLETLVIGGTTCTSLEALQRFAERLSGNEAQPEPISNERRQADVERQLAAAGI